MSEALPETITITDTNGLILTVKPNGDVEFNPEMPLRFPHLGDVHVAVLYALRAIVDEAIKAKGVTQ